MMKKIFYYAIFLFFIFQSAESRAQGAGTNYFDPIYVGNMYPGSSYSDLRNNDSSNGFSNNIGQPSNDIWYIFSINSGATVNISHCGTGMDTYIAYT